MGHTPRHVVAGLAWFVLIPAALVPLVLSGALPATRLHSSLASVVWGVGPVAIFASWALRDAPAHGKSRNAAWGFTAAWFVVFVLAVFPYLFFTRGLRGGLLASVKFACLCLAVVIAWVAVPRLFGAVL
jgi:hypothetical protein